jgi:hypothetical protein
MKHFALVGFLAALLTVKAEAQNIFSVTADPGTGIITISPASSASITLPGNFPTGITSIQGLTLLNLFVLTYEPDFTSDYNLSLLGDSTTNNLQPALSVGPLQNPGSVTNAGRNLDLFYNPQSEVDTGIGIGPGKVISFSGVMTITLSTAFTEASFAGLALGPKNVYAGTNDAYSGDSFLGTYTLTVVPEPSTYAAIAGGLGLAAAVIHRRRQRAKAAQA